MKEFLKILLEESLHLLLDKTLQYKFQIRTLFHASELHCELNNISYSWKAYEAFLRPNRNQ